MKAKRDNPELNNIHFPQSLACSNHNLYSQVGIKSATLHRENTKDNCNQRQPILHQVYPVQPLSNHAMEPNRANLFRNELSCQDHKSYGNPAEFIDFPFLDQDNKQLLHINRQSHGSQQANNRKLNQAKFMQRKPKTATQANRNRKLMKEKSNANMSNHPTMKNFYNFHQINLSCKDDNKIQAILSDFNNAAQVSTGDKFASSSSISKNRYKFMNRR
jgi:hypothetical protein